MAKKAHPPEKKSPPESTVVGIGASAGGLKALKQLFSRPGDRTGLSCVVVVHLSPDHPTAPSAMAAAWVSA